MRKALIAATTLACAMANEPLGAYFSHKTVIIPADDKRDRAGEDAAEATNDLLVLADGVGGWAN
jgi:hypothetical protein